eukprot:6439367-Amphidinium_carterae.1
MVQFDSHSAENPSRRSGQPQVGAECLAHQVHLSARRLVVESPLGMACQVSIAVDLAKREMHLGASLVVESQLGTACQASTAAKHAAEITWEALIPEARVGYIVSRASSLRFRSSLNQRSFQRLTKTI